MSYISQITELRDASDYAGNRPPEMEDVPLDVAEAIVSTPPTAAELNEMGVSCKTCHHFRKSGNTEYFGMCSIDIGMGGEFSDVDADWFCSEHPKLRGEE